MSIAKRQERIESLLDLLLGDEDRDKLTNELFESVVKKPIPQEQIEGLLLRRARVNKADDYGRTPIFYAAEQGNSAIVKILLDAKAQPNMTVPEKECAFNISADESNPELVQKILELKATLSKKEDGSDQFNFAPGKRNLAIKSRLSELCKEFRVSMSISELIEPPLSAAVYKQDAKSVELLLAAKAIVEQQNGEYNELVLAAQSGNLNIVKMLVEARAALDSRDGEGLTALMCAAWNGHPQVVKLLLEEGADQYLTHVFDTAKTFAMRAGTHELVRPMFDKAYENNQTLFTAALTGDERLVRRVLDNKAFINAPSRGYCTVLHELAKQVYQSNDKIVRLLLDKKADVNKRDEEGRIPLYYAITVRNSSMVELLLSRKSGIIIKDYKGQKVNAYEFARLHYPDAADENPGEQRVLNLLEWSNRPSNKRLALCAGLFHRTARHPQNPLAQVSRQSLFNVLRLPLRLAGYAPVKGEPGPKPLVKTLEWEDDADAKLTGSLGPSSAS